MDEEKKVIVFFTDRIEPLLEACEGDDALLGKLMRAILVYALYGEITEFNDRFERFTFKQLQSMIDRADEGNHSFKVNQIIKSNLRYAQSEEDMRDRLKKKGLDEDEIDMGLERYRKKAQADLGLNENGQAKSWDAVDRFLGTDYSKR